MAYQSVISTYIYLHNCIQIEYLPLCLTFFCNRQTKLWLKESVTPLHIKTFQGLMSSYLLKMLQIIRISFNTNFAVIFIWIQEICYFSPLMNVVTIFNSDKYNVHWTWLGMNYTISVLLLYFFHVLMLCFLVRCFMT